MTENRRGESSQTLQFNQFRRKFYDNPNILLSEEHKKSGIEKHISSAACAHFRNLLYGDKQGFSLEVASKFTHRLPEMLAQDYLDNNESYLAAIRIERLYNQKISYIDSSEKNDENILRSINYERTIALWLQTDNAFVKNKNRLMFMGAIRDSLNPDFWWIYNPTAVTEIDSLNHVFKLRESRLVLKVPAKDLIAFVRTIGKTSGTNNSSLILFRHTNEHTPLFAEYSEHNDHYKVELPENLYQTRLVNYNGWGSYHSSIIKPPAKSPDSYGISKQLGVKYGVWKKNH